MLNRRFANLAIVVLTGLDDNRVGIDAVASGAQDYLVKGRVDGAQLVHTIRYAMVRRRLEQMVRQSEAEHRVLFELNPHPVWVYDKVDLRFLAVNEAATRLYGWSREEFLTMRIVDIREPDEVVRLEQELARPMPDHLHSGEWRHRTREGRLLDMEITSHALVFRGREARLVLAKDITEAKRARTALAASEKRFRALVEMSKSLICEHDLNGRLLRVNPAAAQALGYARAELIGRRLQDLVPVDFHGEFEAYLERIANRNEDSGLMVVRTKSGEQRWWEFHNSLHSDGDRPPYVIGSAQDVTERRRQEQRLREQSFSDPLTGLFNRRYLSQYEQRRAAMVWGVIVIDLDHFKQINDTYGHQRGDEVLISMAQFLRRHARAGDAAVRMGGDEFLLVLADADAASTEAAAKRLAERGAEDSPCAFSIGWAVREGDESLEKSIDRADTTLYKVRKETRGYERRKH